MRFLIVICLPPNLSHVMGCVCPWAGMTFEPLAPPKPPKTGDIRSPFRNCNAHFYYCTDVQVAAKAEYSGFQGIVAGGCLGTKFAVGSQLPSCYVFVWMYVC